MLKRILAMLLTLTFLAVLPALSGCEDKSDRISVEHKKTVQDQTVDQKIKVTGD